MKCADVEILLCDYLDGTLAPNERAELESHLAGCTLCAEFAQDTRSGLAFLEHVPDVQPPHELLTRIMHQAPAGPFSGSGAMKKWLNRLFEPFHQPKYVMSAMLTILSLSMLTRCAGVPVRDVKAEDLSPQRVWVNLETKVERVYDRTIKTYESMRLVYEVRQELRQWREQQQEQESAAPVESKEIRVVGPAPNSDAGNPAPPGKK
jgi:Putative zinc-finger